MSTTISEENAERIREMMRVECGVTIKAASYIFYSLTYTSPAIYDDGESSIRPISDPDYKDVPMAMLADFKSSGFRLDGSRSAVVSGHTIGDVKHGVRTPIGSLGESSCYLKATYAADIDAVSIRMTPESKGSITVNGTSYAVRTGIIIPMGSQSLDIYFYPDEGERIEVAWILAGTYLHLENDSLISCMLSLRSDLSIIDQSWEESEMNIVAYWPDDIADLLADAEGGMPVTYSAGYDAEMTDARKFYLEDQIEVDGHEITIKCIDQSADMDDVTLPCETKLAGSLNRMLNHIADFLEEAGIDPDKEGSIAANNEIFIGGASVVVYPEETVRTRIENFIRYGHVDSDNWITFVDAGWPYLSWSKPTEDDCNRGLGIWEICEEDCGDVKRNVERKLAELTTSDDCGLGCTAVIKTSDETSEEEEVDDEDVGSVLEHDFGFPSGCVYEKWTTVSNASTISSTPEKVVYKPSAEGTCAITYTLIRITAGDSSLTASDGRSGSSEEIEPCVYGAYYYYPDYGTLFDRSNITGSFTWKGDPRMQPRDLFRFYRKDRESDDEYEICTIESITLTHEGGGTSAEIAYRKGIC